MRNNFFKSIGYNDVQTTGPRNRPEIIAECQRFRARLRKDKFLNPTKPRIICKSLGDENELSSQLINLTDLAKKSRQEYIIEVFFNNNPASFFRPIPITKQEAAAQEDEANMSKGEITCKIEALLEQMSESLRKRYGNIKSKRRDELLKILEEVKSLFNSDNEVDSIGL